ncbi:MAG: DMT family transporter [Azospirillaceae bacterium]
MARAEPVIAGAERLGLAAAAATGFQVGAALVATRFIGGELGPITIALLRYGIGVLCLVPFAASLRRLDMPARDLAAILALGIAQFGVLVALLNFGLIHIHASRAALLFATFPMLTMLLAWALGREALTRAKTMGVTLTLAGVAITLGEGVLQWRGGAEWLGAAAVLGAALSGAVCAVFYRPYLERYPTLPIGLLAMLGAVVFLALLSLGESPVALTLALDWPGWLAVIFIGLSSGTGYLLWLFALKHASPTRVTVFLALSPPTAALGEAALLGEVPGWGTLAGMVAVAAGIRIATRAQRLPVAVPP